VSYSLALLSPQTFEFDVQTGEPSATAMTTSFTGPAVPIPDANATGVNIPLAVSGPAGTTVNALTFSINGSVCNANMGSTTVGLDHSWVGDLVLRLTSPGGGASVLLMNRPGGTLNSGNNFCQTVLDDAAVNSIQAISPAGNPWIGSFKAAQPLAGFNGVDAIGTWNLNVADLVGTDVGSVRAFSISFHTFVCSAGSGLTTTQQQEQ